MSTSLRVDLRKIVPTFKICGSEGMQFGLIVQASVREVKRLDSISRSPVYSSIGEAMSGLATIRAYRAEQRLSQRNSQLVDDNLIMSLVNQSLNR